MADKGAATTAAAGSLAGREGRARCIFVPARLKNLVVARALSRTVPTYSAGWAGVSAPPGTVRVGGEYNRENSVLYGMHKQNGREKVGDF